MGRKISTYEENKMKEAKVAKRLMILDSQIKRKFSTLWVSVRKAFLDIDENKDGFIEPADILRFFSDEDPVDMVDLEKLMKEKLINSPDNNG